MKITLDIDAPADPDYTLAVADAVSESVRVLNHRTAKRGSLRHPAHASDVVGRLAAAAGGMPQLLGQLAEWLDAQDHAGRVRHDTGGDTRQAVAATCAHLRNAQNSADRLAADLREAHNACSPLGGILPPAEEDEQ